jgi:glyoxalase family protein
VYHLYFGDQAGSPGTIITFFPWPNSRKGRIGGGQVGVTTYAVPPGSLAFWEKRLASLNISSTKAVRFNEQVLQFADNEGLQLELVERIEGVNSEWSFSGVPVDKAIKGFGGAILYSVNATATIQTLEQVMGLAKVGEEAGYARFKAAGDLGNIIDVRVEDMPWGSGGAGTVHHIAWRAQDDEQHEEWRAVVAEHGFQPTPIIDRNYFHAVYYRETGGILFEIATDPPGFAVDEAADELGQLLMLPEWFEPRRAEIEANLHAFEVRSLVKDGAL